jgi:streptogramin lyase
MLRFAVSIAVAAVTVLSPYTGTLAVASADQTDLPFTGLKNSNGVAVTAGGDVYVTDAGNRRVLKLAAGSATQTELPSPACKISRASRSTAQARFTSRTSPTAIPASEKW